MATNIDKRNAWTQRQSELDEFVSSALGREKGASAAFFCGPHGIGKSTAMVMHLVELANQSSSNIRILQLVEHIFQSNALETYYSSHAFDSIPKAVSQKPIDYDVGGTYLRVTDFCQLFPAFLAPNLTSFQGESLIVFKASLHPGPREEWVLGKVLEWLKNEGKVRSVALIVVGTEMTIEMIKHVESYLELDAQMMRVKYKPDLPIMEADNDIQNNMYDFRSRNPKCNMVICACLDDEGLAALRPLKPNILSPRRMILYPHTHDLFLGNGLLVMDSSLHLAAYQPGMRAVAVTGEVRDHGFDKEAAQVTLARRQMTKVEIQSQFSWTSKTDCDPSETTIRHGFNAKNHDARPSRTADHHPAHARDFVMYVLGCVALWPEVHFRSMPARLGADDFVLEEAVHRLRTVGFLRFESTSGLYEVTDRGKRVWGSIAATGASCGFELSSFFSTVADDQTPAVQAAIIRITSVLLVGLRTLVLDDDPDIDALRDHCVGTGKDNFDKGAVWAALGLWEAIEPQAEALGALPSSVHKMGDVRLSTRAIHDIWLIQRELQLKSRIAYKSPAGLTPDEVTRIERELMRAYLHRVIFVDSNQMRYDPRQYDVVSRKEVTMDEEFCDVEGLRDAEPNGFFAIYEELTKTTDGGYHVSDLTYIPTNLYREFGPNNMSTGLAFPMCVAPIFPITE